MLEQLWKRYLHRRGLSLWSLLTPLMCLGSIGYRIGLDRDRNRKLNRVALDRPVISVGNITVGGSGKTPLVAFIASRLIQRGYRVGIVTGGYARESRETFQGNAEQLRLLGAPYTGDEAQVLAAGVPEAIFAVAETKTAAASLLARRDDVDVILIDDGFQHYRMHRDLDIVIWDSSVPRQELHLLPWGILREPLSSLDRSHAILVRQTIPTERTDVRSECDALASYSGKQYVTQFVSKELVGCERRWPLEYLRERTVFVFAGIGNFEPFRRTIAAAARSVSGTLELRDHQRYDDRLLTRIRSAAAYSGADILVTTAKDWVKLESFDFGRECCYLDYTVEMETDEEPFMRWICDHLRPELKAG